MHVAQNPPTLKFNAETGKVEIDHTPPTISIEHTPAVTRVTQHAATVINPSPISLETTHTTFEHPGGSTTISSTKSFPGVTFINA